MQLHITEEQREACIKGLRRDFIISPHHWALTSVQFDGVSGWERCWMKIHE